MENKRVCEICGDDITHKRKSALVCSRECKSEKIIEYKKNYRNINRDIIKEKASKYYWDNIEKMKKYRADYYIKNSDKIKERVKKYISENKETVSNTHREYYKKNKEKIKKYQENNKDRILDIRNIYNKIRRENDILFKITGNIRNLIGKCIRENGFSKGTKTHNILGCSFIEFKIYLESKFEPWMSWDNYGKYNSQFNFGWDIDHIIPMSRAKTEEEVIKLNHYTNLQPLCSKVNRDIKKDNWND